MPTQSGIDVQSLMGGSVFPPPPLRIWRAEAAGRALPLDVIAVWTTGSTQGRV